MSRKRESFRSEEFTEEFYSMHPGKSSAKLKKKTPEIIGLSKPMTEEELETFRSLIVKTKKIPEREIKGKRQ